MAKSDPRLSSFASDKNLQYHDGSYPTHQALLINIQPIERESEEQKLIRELAEWNEWDGVPDGDGKCNSKPTLFELKERARKLLRSGK